MTEREPNVRRREQLRSPIFLREAGLAYGKRIYRAAFVAPVAASLLVVATAVSHFVLGGITASRIAGSFMVLSWLSALVLLARDFLTLRSRMRSEEIRQLCASGTLSVGEVRRFVMLARTRGAALAYVSVLGLAILAAQASPKEAIVSAIAALGVLASFTDVAFTTIQFSVFLRTAGWRGIWKVAVAWPVITLVAIPYASLCTFGVAGTIIAACQPHWIDIACATCFVALLLGARIAITATFFATMWDEANDSCRNLAEDE